MRSKGLDICFDNELRASFGSPFLHHGGRLEKPRPSRWRGAQPKPPENRPMISLFAAEERVAKRERLSDPLQVLDRAIDFAALARAVDAKREIGDTGRGGRPPYPTERLLRLLVVQPLYNLSDEALEYQVLDRSSFQRLAGLEKSGRIPDAKTVWVWRERLPAP